MQAANIIIMAQVVHVHQDSNGALAIPTSLFDLFSTRRPGTPGQTGDAPVDTAGNAPVPAAAAAAAAAASQATDTVKVQDGVVTFDDLPAVDETVIWEGNSIRGTFTVVEIIDGYSQRNGTDRVIKLRPLSGYQKKDLRGQWAAAPTHKKVVYLNVSDVQSGNLRYAA